jgi:hypothetical protein
MSNAFIKASNKRNLSRFMSPHRQRVAWRVLYLFLLSLPSQIKQQFLINVVLLSNIFFLTHRVKSVNESTAKREETKLTATEENTLKSASEHVGNDISVNSLV